MKGRVVSRLCQLLRELPGVLFEGARENVRKIAVNPLGLLQPCGQAVGHRESAASRAICQSDQLATVLKPSRRSSAQCDLLPGLIPVFAESLDEDSQRDS
jgi:hypothetical protein